MGTFEKFVRKTGLSITLQEPYMNIFYLNYFLKVTAKC